MEKLKAQYSAEIANQFEKLSKMEVGSEEYRATEDCINKFADRIIEIEKIEANIRKDTNARKDENAHRFNEAKNENRDRVIRNCISVAGILIPCAITVWGTIVSLQFEEEGSVTTIMGRGFINKLLLKK